MNFDTFPNDPQVTRIEYRPSFSMGYCQIGKQPFSGEMLIVYHPEDCLLEFESFELWLKEISDQPMTIEDLCRLVFDELTGALGDIPLRVEILARTTEQTPP